MPEFRCASLLLLLIGAAAQAAPPTLQARVEQAAREQLERQAQALNLSEPEFAMTVVMPRAAPACSQAPAIDPVDTRSAARMRFAATCRDTPGWRYEYVVRSKVSAMVAVTAAPLAAGQMLTDADIVLERRDISAVSDVIGALDAAVGQASRRTLRAGELLRQSHLAAPVLVRRGEPVLMVARIEAIEISTAGEALDSGARGTVVRVKNVANGRIVRMRVTAAGTVEPVELAAITR